MSHCGRSNPITHLQLRQAHATFSICYSIELQSIWPAHLGRPGEKQKSQHSIRHTLKSQQFQFDPQSHTVRPAPPYWTHTYFFHQDLESIFILSAVLRTFLSRRALLSECRSPTAMAASNTSFRFFWVSAEHSTYVTAPILSASARASSSSTGLSRRLANSIRTLTSCRRSHCVPTRMMGVSGQRRRISGTHFSQTFWKEAGLTTLKHRSKVSVRL